MSKITTLDEFISALKLWACAGYLYEKGQATGLTDYQWDELCKPLQAFWGQHFAEALLTATASGITTGLLGQLDEMPYHWSERLNALRGTEPDVYDEWSDFVNEYQ